MSIANQAQQQLDTELANKKTKARRPTTNAQQSWKRRERTNMREEMLQPNSRLPKDKNLEQ
jgi:hypothetical protein